MIARRLPTEFWHNGRRIKIRLQFDRVLRAFELQKDEVLDPAQKIETSLQILVRNWRSVRRASITAKAEILRRLFNEFIYPDITAKTASKAVVSFTQDAPYIYAAFLMDYGIDLQRQTGKRNALDWRLFLALFRGISEQTKMREIMSIRARPVPRATKHNAEEIKALQEAKTFYKIKLTEREAHESLQRDIAQIAEALIQGR